MFLPNRLEFLTFYFEQFVTSVLLNPLRNPTQGFGYFPQIHLIEMLGIVQYVAFAGELQ